MENSGEGKTYHKTPSQKRFWTPPPMIRFPPPVCFRLVVLLRGNRRRPGKSHFLRPPKLVLEGALYGMFSPPKIARYVLPPPLAAFQVLVLNTRHWVNGVGRGGVRETKDTVRYTVRSASIWRAGTTPILKKTLREFGLKFWRPSNSKSRSESCSENRVCT